MRCGLPRRAPRAHAGLPWLLALGLVLAGCGGREKQPEALTFEKLPDTTGLSSGAPILESFEASRMSSGAVRVSGHVRLPDGTRLQIAVKEPGGRVSVAMAQVVVQGARFDSPPLIGEQGPLPKGDYRFEVLCHFDTSWQSDAVLRATNGGSQLRGPGITRSRDGRAALFLTREARL